MNTCILLHKNSNWLVLLKLFLQNFLKYAKLSNSKIDIHFSPRNAIFHFLKDYKCDGVINLQ